MLEPGSGSASWRCPRHGEVNPLHQVPSLSAEGFGGVLRNAKVPVLLPWPLPDGWVVTGMAAAGDEDDGACGCAVALTGPNPVGGLAEMLVVSEEIGVGLGAYCAGLDAPDPGAGFASCVPQAHVGLDHHEFPLWHVDTPDRAAYAGELMGGWLWIVLWPATAGTLLVESINLLDLREEGHEFALPFGAPSPRLPGRAA